MKPGWLRSVVAGIALGLVTGAAGVAAAQSTEATSCQAGDAVCEADALNRQADPLYKAGEYDAATPILEKALALQEKARGPDHLDVATTLTSLAHLHLLQGRYGSAEPLLLRALAIREKALGPDHGEVAGSLNNLAELFRTQGKYDRAEPLYERALAVGEKTLGPDHLYVATALSNLALLVLAKGAYARAEQLCQRAFAIREKALGPDHPDVAISLNNLAGIAWETGANERAEALFRRALALFEKGVGPDHPNVATTLNHLVLLRFTAGDLPQAVALVTRAAEIHERNLTRVLAVGSEPQRRAYVATLARETAIAPSLARQGGPPAVRFALTNWLRRKGRVLDAMADTYASLRRRLDPEDQKTLERLIAVRSQLGALFLRSSDDAPAAQRRAYLEALGREADDLEATLGRRSGVFRAEDRPVTIPDVQAALPEGAALVELQRHLSYDPKPGLKPKDRWGAARYTAYVLRRAGDPSVVDLGDAGTIDTAVKRLRSSLDDAGHDLAAVRAAARAADALVMAPLRPHLGGLRQVLVSPDGELSLLPFAALSDERGHYLVEETTFTYLTSGRDLLRFAEQASAREGPLVVGHPDYGPWSGPPVTLAENARGRRSRDLQGRMPFKPLEGTAAEARAVAARLPGARLLLDGAATEGAIKAARSPSVLHLATHGFFFADQAADDRGVENALLRSGLVFAGANTLHSGDGDGVLTALEAVGLDLDGTELVVLSACQTGEGSASSGEGVYGLRRALGMAGAQTVVMSLWDADDDATRLLMTAYYGRLEKGSGRSEALREAQLELLGSASTAHPHNWAAFIVSGNGAPLSFRRDVQVPAASPGMRGCACSLGEGRERTGTWAALGMLCLAGFARRRKQVR